MRWTAAGHVARLGAASLFATFLVACGSSEPPPPVATVELSPDDDTVNVGQTAQLTATLKDEDGNVLGGRSITWSSDDPDVASISQTGLVTGVADGTAIITATSENKSGSASILVLGPCSTALAATIAVGQTVNASLANTDCHLLHGSFADLYALTVTTPTNVQIDMTASFDTYLYLLELLPNGELVVHSENDDLDPYDPDNPNDPYDTNSRITFTLQPSLEYFILANSYDPNISGNYQLKVTAVSFVAGNSVVGKAGKARASSLIKALKRAK